MNTSQQAAQAYLTKHDAWPIPTESSLPSWATDVFEAMQAGKLTRFNSYPVNHLEVLINGYLLPIVAAACGMIDNLDSMNYAFKLSNDLANQYVDLVVPKRVTGPTDCTDWPGTHSSIPTYEHRTPLIVHHAIAVGCCRRLNARSLKPDTLNGLVEDFFVNWRRFYGQFANSIGSTEIGEMVHPIALEDGSGDLVRPIAKIGDNDPLDQ